MTPRPGEVRDYESLRLETEALHQFVAPAEIGLVLSSSQRGATPPGKSWIRRGGGGAVLVGPDDLWFDVWIPANDPRSLSDVHASAVMVGSWWARALRSVGVVDVEVVEHPALERSDICFAAIGAGEVTVAGRKAVGITQWRVREGTLVSTSLPSLDQGSVAGLLGLASTSVVHHRTLDLLSAADQDGVKRSLAASAQPSRGGVLTVR